MSEDEQVLTESTDLFERIQTLEETQQATMNLLEDFDEERHKYQQIQKASLNLLEDVNEERNKLSETQRALTNMLEDFEEERAKSEQIQQATMNLLEDFDEERRKYQQIQKASLNLLEDVNEERSRLGETQRALMNMLEDFEAERAKTVQAKELLEVANKELEAFSYSVSHDLRAPLRAIEGFSSTLADEYSDRLDERGQDYLRRVAAAAEHMAKLIDDILGLSRASRAEMHPQPVNLSKMAEDIIDSLHKDEPERQAEIEIEPDLIVEADEHLIRIAMTNLLGNAWKFTSKRPVAKIELSSFEQNGERVYLVKDNGAGFKMEHFEKLFIPFQRLHKERDFPGTGIGLALVQRIVRRHEGRIWAESIVDQGATFYFTLGGPKENGSS